MKRLAVLCLIVTMASCTAPGGPTTAEVDKQTATVNADVANVKANPNDAAAQAKMKDDAAALQKKVDAAKKAQDTVGTVTSTVQGFSTAFEPWGLMIGAVAGAVATIFGPGGVMAKGKSLTAANDALKGVDDVTKQIQVSSGGPIDTTASATHATMLQGALTDVSDALGTRPPAPMIGVKPS